MASPPAVVPRLTFAVTVNGESRQIARTGSLPRFIAAPAGRAHIRIDLTVPARTTVTTLWLGITEGKLSPPGPEGQRPRGMRWALAHTRVRLVAGRHIFRMTWVMPAQLPRGKSMLLMAGWASDQQDAQAAQPVAVFARPR